MTLLNRNRLLAWSFTLLAATLMLGACGSGAARDRDAPAGDGSADAAVDGSVDAAVDGPSRDGGFPDARIDAPGVPFVCDPVHQTGCGQGEKCDLAASGTFACVLDGTLGDFRVCDPKAPNACAAGFTCRGNISDSRCARLCNPAEDQCRVDEPCTSMRTTSDGHPYRMCAIKQECNPILNDCSDPTKQCTWNLGGFCLPPGDVLDGGACRSSVDCVLGSACLKVGLGNVFKCFKLCDPAGGTPTCETGVNCSLFALVGPQLVGACGFVP